MKFYALKLSDNVSDEAIAIIFTKIDNDKRKDFRAQQQQQQKIRFLKVMGHEKSQSEYRDHSKLYQMIAEDKRSYDEKFDTEFRLQMNRIVVDKNYLKCVNAKRHF